MLVFSYLHNENRVSIQLVYEGSQTDKILAAEGGQAEKQRLLPPPIKWENLKHTNNISRLDGRGGNNHELLPLSHSMGNQKN